MYFPPLIKNRVSTGQGVAALILGALAFVFGGLQYGLNGIIVSGFGVVLAVIAGLWFDSSRDADRISKLEQNSHAQEERIAELEPLTEQVVELEGTKFALESQVASLEQQVHSPGYSLRGVQRDLDAHVQLIGLVEKHRRFHSEGLSEWPVLQVMRLSEDEVLVTAHVEPEAERLSGEWVALMHAEAGVVGNGEIVVAEDVQIQARFDMNAVRDLIREDFTDREHISPEPFSLKLVGLTLTPYNDMTDHGMRELRSKFRELSTTLANTLGPSAQLALDEQPETRTALEASMEEGENDD